MTLAPHLDDETLNAVLDGETTADDVVARAHLADCAECRARLAAFTDVAAAVAAPVALPDETARDEAIARALDAGVPDTGPARRNWVPVLAVAAVLVALLVAVPLFGSMTSDDDADLASGGGRDETSTLESAAGSLADEQLVDLGPVDRDTVDDVVAARLAETPAVMAAPAPLEGSADDSGGAASDGDAAATAGDAPPGASRAAGGDAFSADDVRACAPKLDVDGEPVLVGRTTWDGEAAAVLAYRVGDDIRAYVVDPADCSILQFVRFRARS